MTKTWRREMEEAAVCIAFPGWELREDDVIELDMDIEAGYPSMGAGRANITIEVKRSDYIDKPDVVLYGHSVSYMSKDPYYTTENHLKRAWESYAWEDAWTFWQALMRAGDPEEVVAQREQQEELQRQQRTRDAHARTVEEAEVSRAMIRDGRLLRD